MYVNYVCVFTFDCGKTCSDGERIDCVVLGCEFKSEIQTVDHIEESFEALGKAAANHAEHIENGRSEFGHVSGDTVFGRCGRFIVDKEFCNGVVCQNIFNVDVALCVECVVCFDTKRFKHTADRPLCGFDVDVEHFQNVADEDVEIPTATHVLGESRDDLSNGLSLFGDLSFIVYLVLYNLVVEHKVVEVLVVGIVEIAERNLNVLTCVVDIEVVHIVEEVVRREPVFTAGGIVELRLDRGVGALVGAA